MFGVCASKCVAVAMVFALCATCASSFRDDVAIWESDPRIDEGIYFDPLIGHSIAQDTSSSFTSSGSAHVSVQDHRNPPIPQARVYSYTGQVDGHLWNLQTTCSVEELLAPSVQSEDESNGIQTPAVVGTDLSPVTNWPAVFHYLHTNSDSVSVTVTDTLTPHPQHALISHSSEKGREMCFLENPLQNASPPQIPYTPSPAPLTLSEIRSTSTSSPLLLASLVLNGIVLVAFVLRQYRAWVNRSRTTSMSSLGDFEPPSSLGTHSSLGESPDGLSGPHPHTQIPALELPIASPSPTHLSPRLKHGEEASISSSMQYLSERGTFSVPALGAPTSLNTPLLHSKLRNLSINTARQPLTTVSSSVPSTAPSSPPSNDSGSAIDIQAWLAKSPLTSYDPSLEGERADVVESGRWFLVCQGRYRAEFTERHRLGRGGFGEVYECEHRLTNVKYAIKKVGVTILKHDGAAQAIISNDLAIREIEISARLNHPSVVRHYSAWLEKIPHGTENAVVECAQAGSTTGDVWDTAGSDPSMDTSSQGAAAVLFIQMELCSGGTLSRILSAPDREVCATRAVEVLYQALLALDFIHSKNFIHRDIKPSNIFFEGDRLKIGDFGCSRATGEQSWHTPSRRHSEQVSSTRYDHRSDVFSLGIVLYEMLSPPFTTKSERAHVLMALRKGDLGAVGERFPREGALILRMVAPKPAQRPSVPELVGIAREWLGLQDSPRED